MSSEGRKDDTGKMRYDLIPAYPLELLAEVYTIGCKKYNDRNWEKGLTWGRVFAAMMRHAWKWWNGEERDQKDGQHHLASVAWCAFALMEYGVTHNELDDRPNKKAPKVGANVAIEDVYTLAQRALGYTIARPTSSGPAPCGEDIRGPIEGGHYRFSYPCKKCGR